MSFFAEPLRFHHWVVTAAASGILLFCHFYENQGIVVDNYNINLNDIMLAVYLVAFFATLFYVKSTKYRLMTIFALFAIGHCLNGNYHNDNHNYFPQTEAMKNARKPQELMDTTATPKLQVRN